MEVDGMVSLQTRTLFFRFMIVKGIQESHEYQEYQESHGGPVDGISAPPTGRSQNSRAFHAGSVGQGLEVQVGQADWGGDLI